MDQSADTEPGAIAVVGGTGTLGSRVAAELVGRGASVRVLSRGAGAGHGAESGGAGSGATRIPKGTEHRRIDLETGEGLAAALAGVRVVVDCSGSQRHARKVMVDGTGRLLEAGAAAGVAHHLAISIVGIEAVPVPYYKVKLAQETAIEAGPVPWSILRATQFHQLLDGAFAGLARIGLRPTGTARLQPIDPGVVAVRLADAALAPPAGLLPDVAGPKVATLAELSALWAEARGARRLPLRLPAVGKVGRALASGALCAPDAAAGGEDFEEWLRHER